MEYSGIVCYCCCDRHSCTNVLGGYYGLVVVMCPQPGYASSRHFILSSKTLDDFNFGSMFFMYTVIDDSKAGKQEGPTQIIEGHTE